MAFERWMQAVDDAVEEQAGLSVDDLPDQCYYNMYRDGEGAEVVAEKILDELGANFQ